MYLRVSAGDGSYKVVSQPFQPIYEGGQKISFLGQIGDGILFCATQINEVRPFKEDAFRMKDTPFEFRLSIASADFRDQDNRIYGFDITGKKKLSDLGTTIRLCNSTKARIALCDDRIVSFSHSVVPQPSKSRSTAGSSSSLSYSSSLSSYSSLSSKSSSAGSSFSAANAS